MWLELETQDCLSDTIDIAKWLVLQDGTVGLKDGVVTEGVIAWHRLHREDQLKDVD